MPATHEPTRSTSRSREVPPGRDERILREILGEHRIVAARERDAEHQRLVALDQQPERVGIVAPAAFDQLGVG